MFGTTKTRLSISIKSSSASANLTKLFKNVKSYFWRLTKSVNHASWPLGLSCSVWCSLCVETQAYPIPAVWIKLKKNNVYHQRHYVINYAASLKFLNFVTTFLILKQQLKPKNKLIIWPNLFTSKRIMYSATASYYTQKQINYNPCKYVQWWTIKTV